MNEDPLPFSAAAHRNQGPILDVLRALLPARASVLEIASGTGQHAAHFAEAQPGWTWQPTDVDDALFGGVARRCAQLPNVRPPMRLDVLSAWPAGLEGLDAIYCANMIHIAPWPTCGALMREGAQRLVPGGLVVLYGPFVVEGEPTAPSNLAFDADLRSRNPAWGLRRLEDVKGEALQAGLSFERRIAMPANNLVVVFRR